MPLVILCTVAGFAAGPALARLAAWAPTFGPAGAPAARRGERDAAWPALSALTAVMFGLTAARLGLAPELPAYLTLAAACIVLSVVDLRLRRLPDVLTLSATLLVLVLLTGAAAASGAWAALGRSLLGALALFAFYLAQAVISRGGLGLGDVKFALLLGAALGWLGWPEIALATVVAHLLGVVVGAAVALRRRTGRRTRIAFGPVMAAGAAVAVLFAGPVVGWYAAQLDGGTAVTGRAVAPSQVRS